MGGYDYHDGTRASGEMRNFRAGRCIGACLEYAARMNKPVMIYVFSDGSLNATNMVDNTRQRPRQVRLAGRQPVDRRGSFFLVFNPTARAVPTVADASAACGRQIGYYRADGSVETSSHPGANAVNLLVRNRGAQLHGSAWRGGRLPDVVPGPRPRRHRDARQSGRLRSIV